MKVLEVRGLSETKITAEDCVGSVMTYRDREILELLGKLPHKLQILDDRVILLDGFL